MNLTLIEKLIFTYNDSVKVAAGYADVSSVDCCNHEEAYTLCPEKMKPQYF